MATFRKRGNSWRVEVKHNGARKSATFRTKTQASTWAIKTEAELCSGIKAVADKTLGDLLERYAREVSIRKRGHKWENDRINLFKRDPVSQIKLPVLGPSDLAEWRDRRLNTVSPGSVRREWNLLNHAINVAIREWEWLQKNPLKNLSKPSPPPSRDRRISQDEIDQIIYAAGTDYSNKISRVGAAFLFAIETGMRAGEIAGLRPEHIDLELRVAHLPLTKNGTARDVPLSGGAISILKEVSDFDLTSEQISSLFRKIKSRTLIKDLTFHDTRHEAITRLSKKLDVLDLARMVGIRDLKILMVYYNATASEIAERLD
jgi:integrase